MNMFPTIPPIEERALAHPLAAEVIRYIASRTEHKIDVRMANIETWIKRHGRAICDKTISPAIAALEIAGYIELIDRGNGSILRLTEKGWRLNGGKPLWMEWAA